MVQRRSIPTTLKGKSPQKIGHLYDDLRRWHEPLANRLRMRVRAENSHLAGLKLHRAVLEILLLEHQDIYLSLIDRRREVRYEQFGRSCSERAKARSGPLNPMGELTGRNFGAGF
jgi:hypothetical protein